jgi:hypothetical protein
LNGSGSTLALGIIFAVLLPVFSIAWIIWLILTRITNRDVSARAAFFVLDQEALEKIKAKNEKKHSIC